jgi:hypothetical protein
MATGMCYGSTMTSNNSGPLPPASSYASIVNRNVKAEIARAGVKPIDAEAAIGISHAAAARRFSGELDWSLAQMEAIATWLGIPLEHLSSTTR